MEVKNILHTYRMTETIKDDIEELDEEAFMESWNELKRKKAEKYKFLFGG